jgi:hypothetical protein
MQVRRSSFQGDRPPCPIDPTHRVDCHGVYWRYANCDENRKESIDRFLCRPCGHTISVLPDDKLPYCAVSVPLVQKHFDAKARPGQAREPSATEKEKGCLRRAWNRFRQRTAALAAKLGQIMQIRGSSSPKLFWSRLRRLGNLSVILLQLARPFNTSLLGDYRCLVPWFRSTG